MREALYELNDEGTKYIGKVVSSRDGLKGKCIGVIKETKETKELIIIHGKGGRIAYIKVNDIIHDNPELLEGESDNESER